MIPQPPQPNPPPNQPANPPLNPPQVVQVVNNAAPVNNNQPQAAQPAPVQPCAQQILQNFLSQQQQLHQQLTNQATPVKKKRQLSEMLGEAGAICGESMNAKKQKTASDFEIFDGRDVFDLVHEDNQTGDVTIIEAKGGKSQMGTRKGKGGKKIKQCTKPYARFIATKMSTTKYKGSHSRVPCAAHQAGGVQKSCKQCAAEERKRRQRVGKSILNADAGGQLKKRAYRTDYNSNNIKSPVLISSF